MPEHTIDMVTDEPPGGHQQWNQEAINRELLENGFDSQAIRRGDVQNERDEDDPTRVTFFT